MGGNLSRLDNVHVVMLGLDSAGKSTVLYRLKFDQYMNTVPTVGFNCEKIKGTVGKAKGVSFVIWDVGGQDKVRPLWRSYTRATDGLVFVLDAVDTERLEEARVELLRATKDSQGVPILVLANKQDLPGAMSKPDVERALGLNELAPPSGSGGGAGGGGALWSVHETCAVTGEGLDEALESLYHMITKRHKAIKAAKKNKR